MSIDTRVQSLGTDTSERHVAEKERECNSLPGTVGAVTVKRERRKGRRFDIIHADPSQQLQEGHGVEEEAHICDAPEQAQMCDTPEEEQMGDTPVEVQERDGPEHEQGEEEKGAVMEHVVAELVEIRDVYRGQQEALERLIVAMERQSARMERQMDEWRVRDGRERREPRAVEVLIFGVLDVVAVVVLCLLTWCVGKPLGWGRRALRWAVGKRGPEGKKRCSWRMSWRGAAVSDDPFLASAARRLSFSTAADLQN